MSRLLRLLTLVFICVIGISNGYAQISYNSNDIDDIAKGEQKAFGSMKLQRATRYSPITDITYARFNWYIQANKDTIAGNIAFVYKVLASFDTLTFNMNDTLIADSVYYHKAKTAFTHSRGNLKIVMGISATKGTVDSVTIYYHGNPSRGAGFGSFENGVHGSNNDSIVWTLSEPYGASEWWPCKNDLSDKIDSCDIFITTTDKYIASANGAIVSQQTDGKHNYFHFKMHYPVATYLIGIAASNYVYFDTALNLKNSKVHLTYEVYPESYPYFYKYQWQIVQGMHLYDSLYGAYPFSKDRFGITQFGWGGGMEHQTNVFVHDYSFELDLHEMAHQWFGDKITLGSWQDIWLNEGWAVYSSYLCYEYLENGYWWPAAKAGMIGKVISEPDGSVWVDDTTSVSRIFDQRLSYKKGAALLHMLRWEIGDSDFFTGVRAYVSDTDLCYKFARTQQFKQHMETASGKNLDTFFNQWYMGQGFPTYNISYSQAGSKVNIQVKQSTSQSSVPVYSMHIPIELKSISGKDTMLRLWNNDTSQTYIISNVSFSVDSLLFDPQWWLVAGNHGAHSSSINEPALNSIKISLYPNPVNRSLFVSHSLGGVSYRIYDMIGNLITEKNINPGNASEIINLSVLPAGAYVYQLQTYQGKVINRSFVKE